MLFIQEALAEVEQVYLDKVHLGQEEQVAPAGVFLTFQPIPQQLEAEGDLLGQPVIAVREGRQVVQLPQDLLQVVEAAAVGLDTQIKAALNSTHRLLALTDRKAQSALYGQ